MISLAKVSYYDGSVSFVQFPKVDIKDGSDDAGVANAYKALSSAMGTTWANGVCPSYEDGISELEWEDIPESIFKLGMSVLGYKEAGHN